MDYAYQQTHTRSHSLCIRSFAGGLTSVGFNVSGWAEPSTNLAKSVDSINLRLDSLETKMTGGFNRIEEDLKQSTWCSANTTHGN